MKMKSLIALLLCAAMLLVGCGNGAASQDSGSDTGSDVEKIVFATWTINTRPTEDVIQTIEDAINEITVEKIGVEVDFKLYPVGEYYQQVSLALQSGEQIDLFTSYNNFGTSLSTDMCYDITDLFDTYCPNVLDILPESWLQATTKDGKLYGVPTWMPSALASNMQYRKDIADELGIDMSTVKTMADLTPIFEKVHAAYPEMYCLAGGSNGTGGFSGLTISIPEIDYLGDSFYTPAGVLLGDSDTVVNLFETQEYADMCKLVREWYEAGYVMQDLATTTLTNVEILSGGNAFCNINLQGSSPNLLTESTSAQTGYDFGSIYLGNSYLDTASVNANAWSVFSTSKVPEAALRFLDLMYYDADLANLIVYGLEGRDYVVNEDGTVSPPEGFDSSSVPYPGFYILTSNWSMGLTYNQAGAKAEDTQWNIDANNDAKTSPALGFIFDNSPVKAQYAAVNNVIMQYYSGLDCGSVDPEVMIPQFIQALKDAGIDDIVAEKQAQYDAWKAANGK